MNVRVQSTTTARLLIAIVVIGGSGLAAALAAPDALAQKKPTPAKKPAAKAPAAQDGELPPFEILPDEPKDGEPKDGKSKPPPKSGEKKPDEKKPPKQPAGKGKAAKGKGDKFAPLADDPLLPEGTCPMCLGAGHVPLANRLPYVHVEGDRPPRTDMCVPWQFCPQCAADGNVQDLVEAEKVRLQSAGTSHVEWEKRMGMPLVRVETRHVTLHCQMSPDVARKQGEAAEAAIAYIQKTTRGVFLSPTRPPTFELVYLWNKGSYEKAIDVCKNVEDFAGAQDWHLFPQLACFSGRTTTVGNAFEGKSVPPEHLVISQVALRQITRATEGKGRDWFDVGFAYHCEYAVKKKVLMHYVRYQLSETRLGPDWASEARKMAGERKLVPWSEMFESDIVAWQPPHHVTSFVMVSFLMRTDPVRFAKTALLVRDGASSGEAIEKMYGKPIAQMEALCGKWVQAGG